MYLRLKPENQLEKLVYWLIVGTYAIYALGLLYPLNSLFAWGVFFYICHRKWQERRNSFSYDYNYDEYNYQQQAKISIPPIMWVWIIGMLLMGIGTVFSCLHVEFSSKYCSKLHHKEKLKQIHLIIYRRPYLLKIAYQLWVD